jgi:hypothetical protein
MALVQVRLGAFFFRFFSLGSLPRVMLKFFCLALVTAIRARMPW